MLMSDNNAEASSYGTQRRGLERVTLSPAEAARARRGRYSIFRNNIGVHDRESYLCDEIPFSLERPLNLDTLIGEFRIYHHDEKIDWRFYDGWGVPSARESSADGTLVIERTGATNSDLGGYVRYFTDFEESDDEESSWDSRDDTVHSQDDTEITHTFDGVAGGESSDEDSRAEHDSEGDGGDGSWGEEERWDSEEGSLDTARTWRCLFRFCDRGFVADDVHQRASWYATGSAHDFLLTHYPDPHPDAAGAVTSADAKSVTIFRVNESMAFAMGDVQRFVSMERADNYGRNRGSNYGHDRYGYPRDMRERDEARQRRVVEGMQKYRSRRYSWIYRLCPHHMSLPDDVALLIADFYRASPPPFLFVEKGDILLLARYEERIPDPDPGVASICGADVVREHVILARP